MANDDININVDESTQRLVKIRKELGLKKTDVILRPNKIKIDEEISIEKLFHSSGLLIDPKTNTPIFVYIRDHTNHRSDEMIDPLNLKKIHFMVCATLKQMDRDGKFESRYHMTNRTDDRYLIEFSRGEKLSALYPCQNCLNVAKYKCFDYDSMPKEYRMIIVKNFNAKEAIDLLWQIFDIFKKSIQSKQLRSEYAHTNYRSDWSCTTRNFRTSKNFTCERCGVVLSRKEHQKLTDSHHKDGNKRNNQDDNLECLCKVCHSNEHSHYKPSEDKRRIIEMERKRQENTL